MTEEQKRVVLLLNNYRDMKLARELQKVEKEVGYDLKILCSPEEFAEDLAEYIARRYTTESEKKALAALLA